jgi:peroxiredoxin
MKKLVLGDQAPTFTVVDTFGKQVVYNGPRTRSLLIAFLRYSMCPFCNLAIHRLTVEYPILQSSGIDVVAFVQSSSGNIRKHIYDSHAEQPPFPIIPTQSPDVYKMYGVNPTLTEAPYFLPTIPVWIDRIRKGGLKSIDVDGNLFLAPALFMVSPNGAISLAKYKANLYDHALFTEIYETAAHAAIL